MNKSEIDRAVPWQGRGCEPACWQTGSILTAHFFDSDEVCDATVADGSTGAGYIKIFKLVFCRPTNFKHN